MRQNQKQLVRLPRPKSISMPPSRTATLIKLTFNACKGLLPEITEAPEDTEVEPEMLLQPDTRPISHEQLVAEVKRIYAGLVMVEAKCIDIDEKQSAAAQEKDQTKRVNRKNNQWQQSETRFLGGTYERFGGAIGRFHYALAVPDTGADRNVMSLRYAIAKGLEIKTQSQNRGYLQFADGSFDKTMGQVETQWTFASGEQIPITFEILEHCCSDVIIGEEILTEHNVFQDHAESILSDLAFDEDSYELAPFDFVNSWQRGCNRLIEKLSTKKNLPQHNTESEKARIEEQHHRDVWNQKYDFGATASLGERELEKVRREDYISRHSSTLRDHQNRMLDGSQRGDDGPSASQHSGMPMIPSIPTSQSRR